MMVETNLDFLVNGSYRPWIEFRYAEMMFIYAECLAREGKYADARNVIVELRMKRFGREDVYTQEVSDLETALDLILKERATELCKIYQKAGFSAFAVSTMSCIWLSKSTLFSSSALRFILLLLYFFSLASRASKAE
jgi:hypothetical protein